MDIRKSEGFCSVFFNDFLLPVCKKGVEGTVYGAASGIFFMSLAFMDSKNTLEEHGISKIMIVPAAAACGCVIGVVDELSKIIRKT